MRYHYVVVHIALVHSETLTTADLFGARNTRTVGHFLTTARTLTLDAGPIRWHEKLMIVDYRNTKANTTDTYAVLAHLPEAVYADPSLLMQARKYADGVGWADLRTGLRLMGRYIPPMIEEL